MPRKEAGGDDGFVADIELKIKELENSAWLAAFMRELKPYITHQITTIRFLAVGNFGLETKNAEYQTALALILSERFGARQITAWDPNFKKRDLRTLSSLGIAVKEGDPPTNTSVLWFVPHAPYFLEPALLKRIGSSVYVGNDLSKSVQNSMRDDRECAWYRESARISPVKVKPKDPWHEAFKNTAIHRLSLDNN